MSGGVRDNYWILTARYAVMGPSRKEGWGRIAGARPAPLPSAGCCIGVVAKIYGVIEAAGERRLKASRASRG